MVLKFEVKMLREGVNAAEFLRTEVSLDYFAISELLLKRDSAKELQDIERHYALLNSKGNTYLESEYAKESGFKIESAVRLESGKKIQRVHLRSSNWHTKMDMRWIFAARRLDI